MNSRDRRAFWESQDWSKRDTDIAAVTGTSPSVPFRWRRVLGKPASMFKGRHKVQLESQAARCALWDWKLSNAELGRDVGLSGSRIGHLRKIYGAGATAGQGEVE